MGVTINLGRRMPKTAPFLYLITDDIAPDGFTWTTDHSAATWFTDRAEAQEWITRHPRLPSNATPWYYVRSTQP